MNNHPWPTFKTTALTALQLVNHNPQLIMATLLISLAAVIGSAVGFVPLSIAVMVGSYVWNFVLVDLLNQRQSGRKLDWKKLPQLFGYYFKKSWPLMLITALFLFGLSLLFFFVSHLEIFNGWLNNSNSVGSSGISLIFDLTTTAVSLWFIQTVILVVAKAKPVLKALPEAGVIIYQNANFFIMLTLVLETVSLVDRYLFQLMPENIVSQLAFLIFNGYISLLTSAVVLTHFSQSRK